MNRIKLSALLAFGILLSCNQQPEVEKQEEVTSSDQKEVLLIGTFHYNNPGADVAKTKSFDVLSEGSQKELEQIVSKIKDYHPTQIFVEWPFDEQNELDSLYNLYKEDRYFTNDSLSDFYLKNEIFQLAFPAARASNLDKVYAIDYRTSFPYAEVMEAMETAGQTDLKSRIMDEIAKSSSEFDKRVDSGISLTELMYYHNTPHMRKWTNDLHINLMLVAGNTDNFSGPLLTSEWFNRNLYMWSLVQKNTTDSDERIMVLAGASHAAMFDLFIRENEEWRTRELKDIMN